MKLTTFILAAAALCTLTQCQPEATAGGGWAGGIEGYYVNSLGEEVTVNRIDDTHVSISAATVSTYTIGFSNVTMNSATTFTMNTTTLSALECPNITQVNGTGTASNKNITLFLHSVSTPSGDPDDCESWDYTLSATKQ